MANKIKIDNATLKRYKREKSKRKTNSKPKRKYFLIVCEGEKTEPYYFEELVKDLPRGVASVCKVDIEGTGKNTISLLHEAEEIKTKKESISPVNFDKIWIVFDKDSFPAQNFNSTIEQCQTKNNFEAIWSNEAFELWYLLHFHFYQNKISRFDYQQKIEDQLKQTHKNTFKYNKNDRSIYHLLKKYGDYTNAVKYAQKLDSSFKDNKNYADHNPSTKVYKIIEELFNQIV